MADIYTEIATEDFTTGVDGTALTDFSANWTHNESTGFGEPVIYQSLGFSNGLVGTATSGPHLSHWNDDTFPANQYAEATESGSVNGIQVGVAVRCATDGSRTGYTFTAERNSSSLRKVVDGTSTPLGSGNGFGGTGPFSIRLEIIGTTLRPIINGALSTMGVIHDASITSGSPGVAFDGFDTSGSLRRLETWAAGSIVSDRRARVAAINVGAPFMRFQPVPDTNLDNEADRAWIAGFYSGLVSEDTPFSTAMNIGSIEDARDHYRFAAPTTAYQFQVNRTGYQFQAPRTAYHLADGRTKYRFYVKEPE